MKKVMSMIMAAMTLSVAGTGCVSAQDKASGGSSELPKVYFIKEINSENLVKVYEALGRKAEGKVAVKLSTGEPGGHNFLQPALIAPLVKKVNGTIVECNTAYGGGRANTEAHLKAAADHGFTAIAEVDIMDANGEVSLPVKDGKHLKEDFVGKNYLNYDFTVVLSHFKGHAMGGFGGAIKNISIGIASSGGKAWIHSAGTTSRCAMEKRVNESIISRTSFPRSLKYSAIAVAVLAALFRSNAGLSEVATTTTDLRIPSSPKSLSMNSRTSLPRSPISAMTLISALVFLANIPINVDFPTPEPAIRN